MPAFDPTQPATDSELVSAPVRNNFNALKALIDAMPPGQVGPAGPAGRDGLDGSQGPQGDPGDVSTPQMNDAINNALGATSANSNSVAQLGLTISDPPTQSEVQTIANKLDELIAALRR